MGFSLLHLLTFETLNEAGLPFRIWGYQVNSFEFTRLNPGTKRDAAVAKRKHQPCNFTKQSTCDSGLGLGCREALSLARDSACLCRQRRCLICRQPMHVDKVASVFHTHNTQTHVHTHTRSKLPMMTEELRKLSLILFAISSSPGQVMRQWSSAQRHVHDPGLTENATSRNHVTHIPLWHRSGLERATCDAIMRTSRKCTSSTFSKSSTVGCISCNDIYHIVSAAFR